MKGTLYIQRNLKGEQIKKPEPLSVDLYFDIQYGDKESRCQACVDDYRTLTLWFGSLKWITADAILLVGVECDHDRRMFYQEWLFRPEGMEVFK